MPENHTSLLMRRCHNQRFPMLRLSNRPEPGERTPMAAVSVDFPPPLPSVRLDFADGQGQERTPRYRSANVFLIQSAWTAKELYPQAGSCPDLEAAHVANALIGFLVLRSMNCHAQMTTPLAPKHYALARFAGQGVPTGSMQLRGPHAGGGRAAPPPRSSRIRVHPNQRYDVEAGSQRGSAWYCHKHRPPARPVSSPWRYA